MVIPVVVRHVVGGPVALATLAVAACLSSPAHAGGEAPPDAACRPISLAGKQTMEIAQSGRYCLHADLAWDRVGPAIRIMASDVVLDLRGHAIAGEVKTKDQIGVVVDSGKKHIQIENGVIRYMQIGIRAQDVNRLTVKDVEFASVSWLGLQVSGNGNAIVRSRLSDIGHLDDGGEGDAYAVGILAGGTDLLIQSNEFRNVSRQPVAAALTGEGVAILLSEGSSDVRIADNAFSAQAGKRADTIGLWARTTNVVVEDNYFKNIERPVEGAYEGAIRFLGNVFERDIAAPLTAKGNEGQRALALAFRPNSQVALHDNYFKGYTCPVQVYGKVREQSIKSRSNRAVFPQGRRACEGAGAWQTHFVFKSRPRPARP